MEDQGGTFGLVQLVLGALGLSGAGGGLLSAWTHWHSKRAEVAADERKAKADRHADLAAENKALREQLETDAWAYRAAIRGRDDYINRSRRTILDLGGVPEPWPEGWTHY